MFKVADTVVTLDGKWVGIVVDSYEVEDLGNVVIVNMGEGENGEDWTRTPYHANHLRLL